MKPEKTQDERRIKIAVHIVAMYEDLETLGLGSEELKQEAIHDTGLTLYNLCTQSNAQQRAQKWKQRLDKARGIPPGGTAQSGGRCRD